MVVIGGRCNRPRANNARPEHRGATRPSVVYKRPSIGPLPQYVENVRHDLTPASFGHVQSLPHHVRSPSNRSPRRRSRRMRRYRPAVHAGVHEQPRGRRSWEGAVSSGGIRDPINPITAITLRQQPASERHRRCWLLVFEIGRSCLLPLRTRQIAHDVCSCNVLAGRVVVRVATGQSAPPRVDVEGALDAARPATACGGARDLRRLLSERGMGAGRLQRRRAIRDGALPPSGRRGPARARRAER
jgi:hypothetical protein